MKRSSPDDPRSPSSSPEGGGRDERPRPSKARARRLVLLTRDAAGGGEPSEDRATPAPSDEERREARALAEAIERGDDPLALALQAAMRPGALDEADHDALLARAFGDADARPTRAELRAAERLRDALEAPARGEDRGSRDEPAELAGALRAAWRPEPLSELTNRRLIERALRAQGGGRRITPVTMVALSTLAAIAAGAALLLGDVQSSAPTAAAPQSRAAAEVARVALIPARSTAALFDPATPFPRDGGTTERVDRIAAARTADLRANRYAAWGVR